MTVHAFTPRQAAEFVPWGSAARPAFVPWSPDRAPQPAEPGADAEAVPDALLAAAYEEGFAVGQATAEAALVPEQAALVRLAEGLTGLKAEPAAPLALLLVETVDRLVRQVVGEVAIDPTLLLARAHAAAELIVDESRPSALRLNPADHVRLEGAALPVAMLADASIAPGSVVLETASGWIEDGVAARLDALRGALSRIGAA